MPQVSRVQIVLNPSASTREQIVNTWHCVTVGAATTLAAATAFAGHLNTFYGAIDSYLSAELSGASPTVRAFDLSDPKPRQPNYSTSLSALTTGTGRSTREVACCVSYKGIYISGVSPKRKRGRIYLGPLYGAAIDTTTGMLNATMVSAITSAADTLITSSKAHADYRWCIYSPTSDPTGEGNDPDCWDAVYEGWVDNEPDTQRRRGVNVGSKSLFS